VLNSGQQIKLEGTVDSVVASRPENGWAILRMGVERHVAAKLPASIFNQKNQVTLKGSLAHIGPGESLRIVGTVQHHEKFGTQVEVESCETRQPISLREIEAFLMGNVHLIDKHRAKLIVDKFGEQTIDVISEDPDQLLQIKGIGPKILEQILECWATQSKYRELLKFMSKYELPIRFKDAICKKYGRVRTEVDPEQYAESIVKWKELEKQYNDGEISFEELGPKPERWVTSEDPSLVVKAIVENPYRMVRDIRGIGFKIADDVAKRMGIEESSPFRIQAAMLHLLDEDKLQGHCFGYVPELVPRVVQFLNIPMVGPEQVDAILSHGHQHNIVVVDGNKAYHPQIYSCEQYAADEIVKLLRMRPVYSSKVDTAIKVALTSLPDGVKELDEAQADAVRKTLASKVSIITGGPGCGKTTTLRCVASGFQSMGIPITLLAPTGRAAKRMNEVIGHHSSTMHRRFFQIMNGTAPILDGVIIVDEFSMVDIELLASLLKNTDSSATIVFVGDQDQLPSVGPGAVLRDLIESGVVPCSRLTKIFRQAEGSDIIVNAHAINRGCIARHKTFSRATGWTDSDMLFVAHEEAEQIVKTIGWFATTYARKYGYDPMLDVQVIAPGHNGTVGVSALNAHLQSLINPTPKDSFQPRPDITWGTGDRMMNVKNNYDLDVLNGDLGTLVEIHKDGAGKVTELDINFDGVVRTLPYGWCSQYVHLAYATTVHKVQGSEFKLVIMACHTSHYMLLQRNLLYTGVTRAKERMVLVNSPNALAQALKNDQVSRRNTFLAERLRISNDSQEMVA
jgi:exodeoxyribonuclease V alpha subunit